MRTIRSPVTGVVVDRYMSGGERIEEKLIVRVATVDPLRVEVVVPAALYGTIATGAMLTVTPELPTATPTKAKKSPWSTRSSTARATPSACGLSCHPNYELPAGLRRKVDLGLDVKLPAMERAVPASQGPRQLKLERSFSASQIQGDIKR